MAAKIANKLPPIHILSRHSSLRKIGRRTFLSEAYNCNDLWQNRLEKPLIRDIKSSTYFIDVDRKFQTKRLTPGIDIDLFAHSITNTAQLDELEHLLFRFRKTRRSNEMLESTHHAIVKCLLEFGDTKTLFRVLRDRVDYGIFPGLYTYNLLMNTFLKTQNYRDAAEVATLMMLQEDFSDPIARILGLYSCQMFLNQNELQTLLESESELKDTESETENQEQAEVDDEDEENITYVRIPFLRNTWFDDHFDIKDPKHLIGKTFYLIGRNEDNLLGRTYSLCGLGMHQKWEEAATFLDSLKGKELSEVFHEDGVLKFQEMLSEINEEEEKTKWQTLFQDKFDCLKKEGKLCSNSMESDLEKAVKAIPELEDEAIQKQRKVFSEWDKERLEAYLLEEKEIDKDKRLKVIAEKKEELYWKEKLLFFFEREHEILKELKIVDEIIEKAKTKTATKSVYQPPEMPKNKPMKVTRLRRLAMIKSMQQK